MYLGFADAVFCNLVLQITALDTDLEIIFHVLFKCDHTSSPCPTNSGRKNVGIHQLKLGHQHHLS